MDKYFKDIYCIIGYERSGTTMLRTILNNSDELNVHLIEPHYILDLYKIFGLKITDIPSAIIFFYNHKKYAQPNSDIFKGVKETMSLESLQSLYGDVTEISLEEFILRFYHKLYALNLKNKLLLKHPELALHMNTLKKIFPKVKVINMIRDPRSAISSSFARWPSKSFTYRCEKWNSSISLPKKWAVKNQESYLEVIYEDLLSEFDKNLTKICDYLGIRFDHQWVDFRDRHGEWSMNNEYTQKESKGVDKTKISAWKKRLNLNQVNLIENACKKWMIEYNYAFSNNHLNLRNYFFILNDQIKYATEGGKIQARKILRR